MEFPGGTAELPSQLLSSGLSGPHQVTPPEQPFPLTRMSDDALERLAVDLDELITSELEADAEVSSQLTDYIALLSAQVQSEMLRRMF